MNLDPLLGAGIGGGVGYAVDRVASRLAARKINPANPDWLDESEEGFEPIPGETTDSEISRFQRMNFWARRNLSHLACAGLVAGLSGGMILSPAAKVQVEGHADIGVIEDESGAATSTFHGVEDNNILHSYLSALTNSDNLGANTFMSDQGIAEPATFEQILDTTPTGGTDLQDGINDALVRDKAVVVLTADSPVGSSPSIANIQEVVSNASANNERIFIVNVGNATNSSTDIQLNALAKETDGKTFYSATTSPAEVVNATKGIVLPTKSEITATVSSDKAEWGAALGISLAALAIGTWKRDQDVIGREIKKVKNKKAEE